ncbi:MAG: phosphoglucosamine mutase [Epsilonproteobacteria bacterium]|nr:MAG: phosphoglucosamine mutase [Campylobacterota bacterium]RLA65187.1 MAG: phosphoglucosamine mutase [Campylobacterota bacterium]
MDRKLFGTDGIRGKANEFPMTCEVATALGRAVTHYFQKHKSVRKRPIIIVGKDTRLSCYMLEQAFAAGVCSQGGEVILTGPLPTPAVAFVTKSMRADAGVMISASHNKFTDNGIKIFDSKGNKLPDSVEAELENLINKPELLPAKHGGDLGRAERLKEVFGRYVVHSKSAFPSIYDLEGLRIVLDCANGAGYKVAPMIFNELGAETISLGVTPNGKNINFECGSLYPQHAISQVEKYRADLGICLDGDADRVLIIDEKGKVIHGDRLIGLYAKLFLDQGILKPGDEVVGTVMSNLGLEVYLKSLGLKFHRTQVGDRYIIEQMGKVNSLLGGEPSGHIIFKQYATTGDGILSALKAIEAMRFYNKTLRALTKDIPLYPQQLKNVAISKKEPFKNIPSVQKALKEVEKDLGDKGRVLLRYSGTENLARVMVEGEQEEVVKKHCDHLAQEVANSLS